jgi:hypothetical protein
LLLEAAPRENNDDSFLPALATLLGVPGSAGGMDSLPKNRDFFLVLMVEQA